MSYVRSGSARRVARYPDQSSLWESKIELGEKFFHEVITNPIPLDLHILTAT